MELSFCATPWHYIATVYTIFQIYKQFVRNVRRIMAVTENVWIFAISCRRMCTFVAKALKRNTELVVGPVKYVVIGHLNPSFINGHEQLSIRWISFFFLNIGEVWGQSRNVRFFVSPRPLNRIELWYAMLLCSLNIGENVKFHIVTWSNFDLYLRLVFFSI